MPFRHIVDPTIREKMVAAYDLACARLKIDGSDPRSGELATLIIQLGDAQDAAALCNEAMELLQKKTDVKPKLAFGVLRKKSGFPLR